LTPRQTRRRPRCSSRRAAIRKPAIAMWGKGRRNVSPASASLSDRRQGEVLQWKHAIAVGSEARPTHAA
jgi:hypothetical protein